MKIETVAQSFVLEAVQAKAQQWHAWTNKMPPPPDELYVRGQVEVPNPGVDAFLYKRIPQGANPQILLLDLVLVQKPGIWPQVITVKPVAYEEVGADLRYESVEIYRRTERIANLRVVIVH